MSKQNRLPFDEVELRSALEQNDFNITHTADSFRCKRDTVRKYRDKWNISPNAFRVDAVPSPRLSTTELVEDRKRRQVKRFSYEENRKLMKVNLRIEGAFGILVTGDPHVDDDGTDIITMEQHMRICRENDFLLPFCIGDVSNAWVGFLKRLYGEQSTTVDEANDLIEWFVKGFGDWLGFVGGNHDAWLGPGNPIPYLMGKKSGPYIEDEMRFEMKLPNRDETIRFNARHQWPGKSMYNVAHGQVKAFREHAKDHVLIGGHWHECGYSPLKDPDTQRICHAIQVGSYKVYDRYARERGFKDSHFSPAVLISFNPVLPDTHPDMIKVWWDAEEGLDYVKFLRGKTSK